jgi:ubiquinone biosynthesis protein Coq4
MFWWRRSKTWIFLSPWTSEQLFRGLQVRFVDDEELAYIAVRSREVHDFWHVLFDCPTTVTGELALKMVEWVQVSQ